MKSFIKAMDGLDKIIKIILCIPVLQIVWGIYRLLRSCDKKNILGIIIAVLLIVPGAAFMWLVDLVSIILWDKVLWID